VGEVSGTAQSLRLLKLLLLRRLLLLLALLTAEPLGSLLEKKPTDLLSSSRRIGSPVH